jgi:hypothetical protein
MLFLDQVMFQPLSGSDSGHKIGNNVDSSMLQIFLSPWNNSSELTPLPHFIFQTHMVAQLGSLIWVKVPFVVETMKQVSSNLELIWIFKNSSQNSKGLVYHLTDVDMLAFHVL